MLIGGYVWLVTSGNDDILLNKGRMVARFVIDWFEDADVDFYGGSGSSKIKKKSRRWD